MITWYAIARVGIYLVNAMTTVLARIGRTIIDVDVAELTYPTWLAMTSKRINFVFACCIIQAKIGFAIIDVVFAVIPVVASRTIASVTVNSVNAFPRVLTGVLRAIVDI